MILGDLWIRKKHQTQCCRVHTLTTHRGLLSRPIYFERKKGRAVTDATDASSDAGDVSSIDAPEGDIRIALVLNGGVSLAVWMGGVVHELNRLRLASESWDGATDDLTPNSWRTLLRSIRRSVHIDLIAGTSAGGLNGAVLATAIARGVDMPNMGQNWVGMGSLNPGALTFKDPAGATSILNGEYFTQKISGIVSPLFSAESVRSVGDCTLLTTATALFPAPTLSPLVNGATVATGDGRRLYRFSTAASPGPGLSPGDFDTPGPLITAMRATASFPVAFDPVLETDALKSKRTPKDDGPCRWLIDGGVLDNAPFEPLLDELVAKPVQDFQRRTVLYVTPGVDSVSSWPQGPGPKPTLQKTLRGVLGASRQPDQRLDQDRLAATFELMSFTRSQPHTLFKLVLKGDPPLGITADAIADSAAGLFPQYRRSRFEAVQRRFERSGYANVQPLMPGTEPELDNYSVPGIPTDITFDAPWEWGVPTADRVVRWLGRAVADIGFGSLQTPELRLALKTIANVQRTIADLTAARNEALRSVEAPVTFERQLTALTAFYEENSADLDGLLSGMFEVVSQAFDGTTPSDLRRLGLGLEVHFCSFNWGGCAYDTPRFDYVHLTPDIAPPDCLELYIGDDNNSWATKKLFGERWGHFGAFATEEGRRHDWLWGRIDGAKMISDFLGSEGVSSALLSQVQNGLMQQILLEEGTNAEQVSVGAADVYAMSPSRLLADMVSAGDPEAKAKLLDTVAEVTRQLVPAGRVYGGLIRLGRFIVERKLNKAIRNARRGA